MGWERKRGKLHELNRLLRGATDTTFMDEGGEPATAPAGVRYVLTLDADTRLPRATARRLIGTIAHPLNRPVYDPDLGRVTQGHAILQPRVVPTLQDFESGSLHQEIYAGPRGIDAYEFAVSDIYQDLFDEGIYIGKGLYEVDAFEQALSDRVPENTLLSHDLFEGVAARAALVSDIELFEEFPGHYEVNMARRHRWVRGDWQLLPWIFGGGPGGARRGRKAIPLIGRWKMIDNLRRSLVPPTAIALLVASWCMPEPLPLLGTIFILVITLVPCLTPLVSHLSPARPSTARRVSLSGAGHDAWLGLVQAALAFTLLAHQAWVMSDAIARTLWRLVSRRNLLEWVTAAAAHTGFDLTLSGFYRRMAGAVGLAITAGIVVGVIHPEGLLVALPVIVLWLASPAVARWISLPRRPERHEVVSADEEWMLRSTARRTWHFFERFVTASDNYLPPDNFQEDPRPEVAHRTSPTNIGLYLLSAIAARDFGWIGTLDLIERLEATCRTLDNLQKFRGHLYNWYETRTLEPLEPRYVSTVDSGNLAGHLIVVRQACLELLDAPPDATVACHGTGDTLHVLRDVAGDAAGAVLLRELEQEIEELEALLKKTAEEAAPREGDRPDRAVSWQEAARRADELVDTVEALREQRATSVRSQMVDWAIAVQAVIESHRRDEAMPADAARSRLLALADWADAFGKAMRFDFLYNRSQKLFAIGYRPADNALDTSTYDLLASEARLASLVAIARGEVPASHWFRLGRPMIPVDGGAALVSWSASMFEYLMPELVMAVPAGSILSRTARCVVGHQIAYGREKGVPWGISESAYNVRDLNLTYQYSNFGVSGLGLKRGLSQDVVVAPYATALAAMIDPSAAAKNMAALTGIGARGAYGFYEAVDYTANRACRRARTMPSSAPIWRTIRG